MDDAIGQVISLSGAGHYVNSTDEFKATVSHS